MTFGSARRLSSHRGYGLVEITISAFLLVVAMGIVAQTIVWLATETRGGERRQRALQEAANLMERLSARPWSELTPDVARSLTLSQATASILHGGKLEVTIDSGSGDPKAKRITILIRWDDASGGSGAHVRLVSWVHRRGSGGET